MTRYLSKNIQNHNFSRSRRQK